MTMRVVTLPSGEHSVFVQRDEHDASIPTLLFVHGFPLDHTMWRGQWDALAPAANVIAPDLRGFGASPTTDHITHMADFADDLAAMLTALDITSPVVLCGLSMGGYIAFEFWQRHRERLAGLILCDTKPARDTEDVVATRLKLAESILENGTVELCETMPLKLFAESTFTEREEIVTSTKLVIRETSPQAIAAASRGMAERRDFTDRLGEIKVPTLVLCGQQDAITPCSTMREMSQRIPNAEFVEVPHAGHMAPLEQPEFCNQVIKAYLLELTNNSQP